MLSPLARVVCGSQELRDYEQFVAAQVRDTDRDYLFLTDRARFEPRREDVLVAAPGLTVLSAPHKGSRVRLGDLTLDVPGVSKQQLTQFLEGLGTDRVVLELLLDDVVEQRTLAAILRALFGKVLFAPSAVAALETRLSFVGLVRHPNSPYGVVRSYWENMIDVQDSALAALVAAKAETQGPHQSVEAFAAWLCELHVLATMGKSLDSFYKPQSPIADGGVAPGQYYDQRPRLLSRPDSTLLLSGPRVRAPEVGGKGYFEALCASLGDPAASADTRTFPDGGQLVFARSETERQPRCLFLPARPLAKHFTALWAAFAEMARNTSDATMARFHYRFVRLHPFRCANQSIAMNIVGAALAGRERVLPHLMLDHFALRMSESAYEELFARAVRHHAAEGPPAERLRQCRERCSAMLLAMDRQSAAVDPPLSQVERQLVLLDEEGPNRGSGPP